MDNEKPPKQVPPKLTEPTSLEIVPKNKVRLKASGFVGLRKAVYWDFLSWLDDKSVKYTFRWFLIEVRGVRRGSALFLVFLVCFGAILWHEVYLWDEANFSIEKATLISQRDTANQARDAAIQDDSKYQVLYKQDEGTLVTVKAQIGKEFPNEPVEKGVASILEKIDSLQNKLNEGRPNPLIAPITSASAEAEIIFASTGVSSSEFIGPVEIRLRSQSSFASLMTASTGNNTSSQSKEPGVLAYTTQCSVHQDDPAIGKPVEYLSGSEFIAIIAAFIPPNTHILSGRVVWTINNQINLSFDIPPQTSILMEPSPTGGNFSAVVILDIQKNLVAQLKQQSLVSPP